MVKGVEVGYIKTVSTYNYKQHCDHKNIILGYCQEPIREVLKTFIKDYVIDSYKEDDNLISDFKKEEYEYFDGISFRLYDGLYIREVNEDELPGCEITGSVNSILNNKILEKMLIKETMTIERVTEIISEMVDHIEHCRKIYLESKGKNKQIIKYEHIELEIISDLYWVIDNWNK